MSAILSCQEKNRKQVHGGTRLLTGHNHCNIKTDFNRVF